MSSRSCWQLGCCQVPGSWSIPAKSPRAIVMAFTAEVLSAGQGGGHAVVVPQELAAAFSGKPPHVLAHGNGVEYHSRLMVYGGQSYLGLRKDLLRQLQVAAGDQGAVELPADGAGGGGRR